MTGLQADGKGAARSDSVLAAWCGGLEAGNASAAPIAVEAFLIVWKPSQAHEYGT